MLYPHANILPVAYYDKKLLVGLTKTAFLFLFLAAFYSNDGGIWLSLMLKGLRWHWVKELVYTGIFYAALHMVIFPLDLWEEFILEKKHQVSRQTPRSWFFDYAKSFALGYVLVAILVICFYAVLRSGGKVWYVYAWGMYTGYAAIVTMLVPQVIIPLFFSYSTVPDAGLRTQLLQLARAAGVLIQDVYVINASVKTTKANAFICGLGRTKRLVLTDTLLSRYSDEEVKAAVAHELAHVLRRDSQKMLILQSAASFLFLWIAAFAARKVFLIDRALLYDVGSLPFFTAIFFMLNMAASPVGNAYSRWMEARTDQRSFSLLPPTQGFISLMEKLTAQNLSEFHPARWKEWMFFNHPSSFVRIQKAREWKP